MTTAQIILGTDRPGSDYDDLMATMLARFYRDDRDLFKTKWFDYREMHMTKATYLYAAEFVKAYRRVFRANVDHAVSEYIKPMRKPDLFDNDRTFITGIWRGRQFADALGMPYAVFLEGAFHHRLRYWRRPHLPRPHQLYQERKRDDEDMRQSWFINAMEKFWEERQASSLFYSTLPTYRVEGFIGAPAQIAHREWLIKQVNLRQNPAPLLTRFVDEQLLPLELVRERFAAEIVAAMRSL